MQAIRPFVQDLSQSQRFIEVSLRDGWPAEEGRQQGVVGKGGAVGLAIIIRYHSCPQQLALGC